MANKKDHAATWSKMGKALAFMGSFHLQVYQKRGDKAMSYTAQETREHRAIVALELARHIALMKVAQNRTYMLDVEEFNNIMVVAGMPLLMPEEVNIKEIDVIKVDKVDKVDEEDEA